MDLILDFLARHPVLTTAFIVVLVAVIGNEIAVIVDVRSQADYRKGHIIGALNLPLARIGDADKELAKHKSKPVLLYCAIGTAAGAAREKLLKQGWDEVFPLRGGLNAWQGAGLPVTKGR